MNIRLNLSSDPYPGAAVKYGDKGNNVAKIQVWLNYLSKNYPLLSAIKIDGVFGNKTQNDVVTYQTMFALKADGIVGSVTWNSLSGVYNASLKGKIIPITPIYPGYSIQVGASGNDVKNVQYMMNVCAMSGYFREMENVIIDGKFGIKSEKSIKKYQQINQLKADGIVGKITYNSLLNSYTKIILGNYKPINNNKAVSSDKDIRQDVIIDEKEKTISETIIKTKEIMEMENIQKKSNMISALALDPYPGTPIKYGSTGPNVVKIQTWLNNLAGVYSPLTKLSVDGKFGNSTKSDVQTFQVMFGLKEDGIVGEITWNKLNEVNNIILTGIIKAITPNYVGYPLSSGSSGNHVKCIQYMLNVCHQTYPEISLLNVDGKFGAATTNSVKVYQSLFSLNVDGVVGLSTWNSLLGTYTEIINGKIPPPPNPDKYPGTPIQNGDSGPNVIKIQTWLNQIAQYYSPVTKLTVDGKFGTKTQNNVEAFQSMFGLEEDGIVGQITWNKLVQIKNSLSSGIVLPITPKYIGYPLSAGSSGNHVRCIQYMLNTCKTKYPTIPLLTVDGNFGSQTTNAVKIYQGLFNLKIDGIVAQITWNSLLITYTDIINGTDPPPPIDPDAYPGYPIQYGDSGSNVTKIQTWLNIIADGYSPITRTTVDGVFGQKTLNDVKTFQVMFGFPENGIVDETTWNKIVSTKNSLLKGKVVPITPNYIGYPLSQGATGNTVKCIQYMLNTCRNSYPAIPILTVDGIFGLQTTNAVKIYQGNFCLTKNGVVDKTTWTSILSTYTKIINGSTPPIDPDTYPGHPIQFGDSGSNVIKIQTWLNEIANYYSPITKTNIDGQYGSKTEADIMTFQTMFGLTVDGIVGKSTWDKLVQVKNSLLNSIVLPITPKYIGYPLSQGSTGNTVKCIQYMLDVCRQNNPTIPNLTVDGIYGSQTVTAVKEFQRLNSLTIDGVVGQITWNSILNKYTAIITGASLSSNEYTGIPIKLGDDNEFVLTIQTWMNEISKHYTPLKLLKKDGYFGIETMNNVMALQNLFDLYESGIVEETSWNALKYVSDKYKSGVITSINPVYPGIPLKMGATGNAVKSLQYMLNILSDVYSDIPKVKVEGVYSSNMKNSMIIFQLKFNLKADGITGLNTWNKLSGIYTAIINK